MIKLETDNALLLDEREKARGYLIKEVLKEDALALGIIDDLINLAEIRFSKGLEINQENISLLYSKIYSPDLKLALPPHVVKQTSNLNIVK